MHGVVLGFGLLSGVLGGFLWHQSQRARTSVVFVKTNEVMARYKGMLQMRETLQKETAGWAEEARQIEEKLRGLMASTQKPTEAQREQAVQMNGRLDALRRKGAQREQELMGPVVAEVNAGIKRFAQRRGHRLVFGTLQGGVILHGDEGLDVTEELLKELNQ